MDGIWMISFFLYVSQCLSRCIKLHCSSVYDPFIWEIKEKKAGFSMNKGHTLSSMARSTSYGAPCQFLLALYWPTAAVYFLCSLSPSLPFMYSPKSRVHQSPFYSGYVKCLLSWLTPDYFVDTYMRLCWPDHRSECNQYLLLTALDLASIKSWKLGNWLKREWEKNIS